MSDKFDHTNFVHMRQVNYQKNDKFHWSVCITSKGDIFLLGQPIFFWKSLKNPIRLTNFYFIQIILQRDIEMSTWESLVPNIH